VTVAADVVVNGEHALPAVEVSRVVRHVLAGEQRSATISVTFLSAAEMQDLNREHKGHDRPTDVISFALPQPDGGLAGDIYICPTVARHEAAERGITEREELIRLVVHGTLHVLGLDHPEGEERESSEMWQRQERYVAGLR
jgi:probable rRNA maturation factor